MAAAPFTGSGTESDPWVLKTPSLGSDILMTAKRTMTHRCWSAPSAARCFITT